MSYEILYDKQFVKLERTNTFVPITIHGSNNCYQAGADGRYNKRERSCSKGGTLFLPGGKIHGTEQEMLDHVKSIRDGYANRERPDWDDREYSDDRLGNYMGITNGSAFNNFSYGQYKGWVTTGCKKALTIEKLAEHGHYLTIFVYAYRQEELEAATGEKSIYYTAQNEEMFFHWLEKAQKLVEGTNYSVSVTMEHLTEKDCQLFRKLYFPRKRSEPVDLSNGYYSVKIKGLGYLVKRTSRCVRYCGYPYVKYPTLSKVKQRVKSFNKASGHFAYPVFVDKDGNISEVELA